MANTQVFERMYVIEDKTADYTITAADMGKIFTNRGATGAVTFTLPAAAAALKGRSVLVFVVAGQNVTVAGATADQMVVFNDATADSIAFSTAAELIGGCVEAICSGTDWLVRVALGSETQTPTIAT